MSSCSAGLERRLRFDALRRLYEEDVSHAHTLKSQDTHTHTQNDNVLTFGNYFIEQISLFVGLVLLLLVFGVIGAGWAGRGA